MGAISQRHHPVFIELVECVVTIADLSSVFTHSCPISSRQPTKMEVSSSDVSTGCPVPMASKRRSSAMISEMSIPFYRGQ